MAAQRMQVEHLLPPIFDKNCTVLILGSMPSPRSRESGLYYGHPQNRFWPVMEAILDEPLPPRDPELRGQYLLRHHIALWDVIASCSIAGADDNSIGDVIPNDLTPLFAAANIKAVYTTGLKAYRLYNKLLYPSAGIPAVSLPSTSPANARTSLTELIRAYSIIKDHI